MSKNFGRMIQLAMDTFAVHNDPDQLDVDEKIIQQLEQLHPDAVSELANEDGPVIWVLLIPTTHELMNEFINKKITETEFLDRTKPGLMYDALYLCSAMTLPEFRGKGATKKIALEAIRSIRSLHPIKTLFVWNFSGEGAALANSIAQHEGLPLLERVH